MLCTYIVKCFVYLRLFETLISVSLHVGEAHIQFERTAGVERFLHLGGMP